MNNRIQHICIHGDDLASSMVAAYLHKIVNDESERVKISIVIEDSEVPFLITDGESAHLAQLLMMLQVLEMTWMERCKATFRLGSRYEVLDENFYIPFGNFPGNRGENISLFQYWAHKAKSGKTEKDLASSISELSYLMSEMKVPRKAYSGNKRGGSIPSGYNVDQRLLADLVKKYLESIEVIQFFEGKVDGINSNPEGKIESIHVGGNKIEADFYISTKDFATSSFTSHMKDRFSIINHELPFNRFQKSEMHYDESDEYNELGGGIYPYLKVGFSGNGMKLQCQLQGKSCSTFAPLKYADPQEGTVVSDHTVSNPWNQNLLLLGRSAQSIISCDPREFNLLLLGLRNFIYLFPSNDEFTGVSSIYNEKMSAYYKNVSDYAELIYLLMAERLSNDWAEFIKAKKNSDAAMKLHRLKEYWDSEMDIANIFSFSDYAFILGGLHIYPKIQSELLDFYKYKEATQTFNSINYRGNQTANAYTNHAKYFMELKKIKSFQEEQF